MTEPGRAELLDGWRALAASGATALGEQLLARYDEPHRRYHNRRHLAEVLTALDLLDGSSAVRLAAWFHDAVYDPRRPDNEERSAAWAAAALPLARVPALTASEVARLVRLTADHDPAAADADGAALCDADLAILAAPPDRYDAYAAAVRAEYAHVPADDFRTGRSAVLRGLLGWAAIYRTPHGATSWEAPARDNLSRELRRLDGPVPGAWGGAAPPR